MMYGNPGSWNNLAIGPFRMLAADERSIFVGRDEVVNEISADRAM